MVNQVLDYNMFALAEGTSHLSTQINCSLVYMIVLLAATDIYFIS